MDYNIFNIFKEIPYFLRVDKTLMDKFTMITKTCLGKTMPLTQQWLQDPLKCFQNMPRKNNASHSTVATRSITMFPKHASHSTTAIITITMLSK
jgi:hypothetical protein